MEIYLISLAAALVGGLMLSRVTKLLNLPAVTAYLIAGLILGPFCIGKINIPGLGFSSLEQIEGLTIVTQTALGFIAFTIGNEFRVTQLKKNGIVCHCDWYSPSCNYHSRGRPHFDRTAPCTA